MRDTTSMELEGRHQSRRRQEPTVAKEGGPAAASDDDDEEEESSSDGEFEFPSVSRDFSSSADELFAGGGRAHAFYPVFGRVLDEEAPAPAPRSAPLGRLFQLEQARTSSVASTSSSSSSSSSSADAGLDTASPDSYCLWAPGSSPASSPSPTRKSGSTGSVARWRRIGELVAGGRSRSDGKDRFLFLSAPSSPARDDRAKPSQPPPKGKGSSKAAATELDAVAAGRRMSGGYGGGANNNKASNGGRRTFLPYRQDLVGLFATVHGLSRSPHPF